EFLGLPAKDQRLPARMLQAEHDVLQQGSVALAGARGAPEEPVSGGARMEERLFGGRMVAEVCGGTVARDRHLGREKRGAESFLDLLHPRASATSASNSPATARDT